MNLRSLLHGLARDLRHAPDRLVHPLRRRRALARLADLGPPASVLFVCHGNICRSPYAAAVFDRALPSRLRGAIRIDSAGFIGPGRSSPAEAVEVAAEREIDLSLHRSQLLCHATVSAASLIVVMTAAQSRAVQRRFSYPRENLLVLGDLDPEPIDTRTIRDPIEQAREVFAESYARIDRCVRRLAVATRLASGTPATPSLRGGGVAPV